MAARGKNIARDGKIGGGKKTSAGTKGNAGTGNAGNGSSIVCSKCSKEAVICPTPDSCLCKKHFNRHVESVFFKTVREFSMIRPHSHVAVALSGGKDSTALLHLLCRLSEKLPMRLSAILIDEGIAAYRPHSIVTARRECAALGVELHVVSFREEFGKSLDGMLHGREKGRDAQLGACSVCGVLRRTLLNRAAKKIGADALAVGHNADDAAQTILMNLMRNEPARLARFGIAGGIAEDASLVRRIKPLIRLPEKEIALYALLGGMRIHFMQCPYAEEALRQDVRRSLNALERKYPGTKMRMLKSFIAMRPALMAWARGEMRGGIGRCASCGDASSQKICSCCLMLQRLGIKKIDE